MKKLLVPFIALGVLAFAACSKKASPSKSEPSKVAATTYDGSVHALIQAKCSPCHITSKGGRKADFDSYGAAMKYGSDMVARIEKDPTERGFMPFKNPKLSADEIAVFKKWVAGGMAEK
jgi:uncharacterized membrane protein